MKTRTPASTAQRIAVICSMLAISTECGADTTSPNAMGYAERTLGDGHVFVDVPAGKFSMGTLEGEAKELPIHDVYLDQFWIAKFPVTVAQFAKFVDDTSYITDAEKGEGCWIEEGGRIRYDVSWREPNFEQPPNHPVICVSWNDAMAYADWFSKRHDVTATLPTEAQWEKAARGSDQRTWPWGNDVPDGSQANFADANYSNLFGTEQRTVNTIVDDGYAQTSPVDAYPAGQSPYGVFDMAGNTIDWLYDRFDRDYYQKSPERNPIGPQRSSVRVKQYSERGWGDNLQRSIRGGSWTDASGVLSLEEGGHSIRSDMRERTDQYSSDDHLSFRLVLDDQQRHAAFQAVDISTPTKSVAGAAVSESIGEATVSISYDRLAVGDREAKTFGFDIPHGQLWSPGDKTRTRIDVSADVQIREQTLPAGSYTLFMTPEAIPEGGSTWSIAFATADPKSNNYEEALRLATRAQLEDNSKSHLEYFFDERDGIRILRFLFDFVEVHIPFDHPRRHANETSTASVKNAMADTEITVSYVRHVIEQGSPSFGNEIAFNKLWDGGGSRVEFSQDVLVNGKVLRAGIYSMSFLPIQDGAWSVTLTSDEGTSDVFEVDVDLGDSGPTRLEYYFDYVSDTERQLVMAWGGANAVLTVGQVATTQHR